MSAAEKLRKWRAEPVTFAREVLRFEPDPWQVELFDAVTSHNRLALKASKGVGKSAGLAVIGWWFLLCFPHPKLICTSVTGDNLRDGLWTEYAVWQQRSELLKQAFTWSAERIVANDHPETWFASARRWNKDANPQQQGETLAGLHADFLMFQIDEAGGVPDAVAAAAEAGLANADAEAGRRAWLAIAGNPTQLEGPLFRACTRERHLWWVKEISGDPDDPKRAPRVSPQWAREQIQKFGRESPWVLVNVFGQFPPGQSNALISAEIAGQAARRELARHEYAEEPLVLGVDVARHGDDRTVFQYRRGRVAFAPKVFRNLSLMETADRVAWEVDQRRPDAVFIDATGIGWGVFDRVQQLGHEVFAVESGSKPLSSHPKLQNRRCEMWWRMAEWVKQACIPDDGELIAELTAPTFKFDGQNTLVLESKKDLKRRGLPSPDKADALALTFAAPVVRREAELPGERDRPETYDPFAALERRDRTETYDPFTRSA